ncbi:Ribosome biogenesis protein SLX9 family protein [Leishmania donovani]|uniref:Ribosome biogenesis protein SLX9 family protein n=1 Tax=Leishmania donovani TaxID=5661 RepID=A0A504XCN4_LEIDO|nr:Ribosome biogenesis protein SLX9 family protein [Leishmania donovani]
MAGGKSSKRVKLRTKIARRQQTQHATDEHAPSSSGLSSSPPPVGGAGEATAAPPTEVDRQAALHIRDALRQRQGRTGRAPAMKVKEARGVRATAAPTRMTVAQEELQLFDAVQTVPAYAEDPFAAVMQHLSATMDVLQPQTPDEGLAARPCTLWLVHRLQESALPEGRVQPQPLPTKTLSTSK